MRDKPRGIEIERIVLFLREMGREVLGQPFNLGSGLGRGSTRRGERRWEGHMIGKPWGEESSGCHSVWLALPFHVPGFWALWLRACPLCGQLWWKIQAFCWLLPGCTFFSQHLSRLP